MKVPPSPIRNSEGEELIAKVQAWASKTSLVAYFDRCCIRPWDETHNRWPHQIDGNTTDPKVRICPCDTPRRSIFAAIFAALPRLQTWRSRPPTVMYGVILTALFSLTIRVVSDAATMTRIARTAERGGIEDFVACCVLLCVLLNASFAYTNFVTTARSTLWRGLHGGIRDIAIVNLSVPVIVWCTSLHEPGRMLPIHSAASRGGSAAASPLAAFFVEQVSPYGAGLGLGAGLLLGLHILHIARGRFDGSMSGVDVAQGRLSTVAIMATKLALIAYLTGDHFAWLQARGEVLWGAGATLAAIACIAATTWVLQPRGYYLHLHHWFMGLVLSPLAVCEPPWWSGVLLGVALGQFVEGAARWSVAPLWNASHWHGATVAPPVRAVVLAARADDVPAIKAA